MQATADSVGERLKLARKNAGFTQNEVSRLMNMAQQNYARYESGTVELNYEKMIFLCKLYGVSADYLLGLEDETGRNI